MPRMTKPAFITISDRNFIDRDPGYLLHFLNDHLRHSVSGGDDLGLLGQIHKDDLDLSPVISINRAGRVQAGKPLLDSESAPGPYLGLITFREFYEETGWNSRPFQGTEG